MSNAGDPAPDHVQRGLALEGQGDDAGAEAAYALADQAGSADGAFRHGILLQRRGDLAGAQAAYRRGEERGDPRASCHLGFVLEDTGDIEGAKDAYRRADAVGFPGGAYTLSQLHHSQGDLEGALMWAQRADDLGDSDGAYNVGVLLQGRGDMAGAESAYLRASQRGHTGGGIALGRIYRDGGNTEHAESFFRWADSLGDGEASFELGALLYDHGDVAGALEAFDRAAERGRAGAAEVVRQLRKPSPNPEEEAVSPAWAALREAMEAAGADRISATALVQSVPIGDSGRTQRVWISYDVIAPDYEVVRIQSPFARIGKVSLDEVVREAGQLLIGGVAFSPAFDASGNDVGLLTIGSTFPLTMLNPNEASSALFHMALLAGAADGLEARWSGGDLF